MLEKGSDNCVHALWDELADFDAARSDQALTYLMGKLCLLVGAWNASWMGGVRLDAVPGDPVKGWRPRCIRFLHPSPLLDGAALEQLGMLEQGVVDITTIRSIENAGVFRANRLCDLVSSEWFESPYYHNYYLGVGRTDAVWVAFPVNKDTESWFGIFRTLGQPAFTEAERDVIAYALRGIKWFHRQLMLSHGLLVAANPLTPNERKVLHLLLTGLSEKSIAAEMARSYHTTHECVGSIFRKFGVNNRSALMSLWLGRVS